MVERKNIIAVVKFTARPKMFTELFPLRPVKKMEENKRNISQLFFFFSFFSNQLKLFFVAGNFLKSFQSSKEMTRHFLTEFVFNIYLQI